MMEVNVEKYHNVSESDRKKITRLFSKVGNRRKNHDSFIGEGLHGES